MVDLTYRDDLESLAYTLIRLFRGNLPWTYFVRQGTTEVTRRQAYEQKKRYDGWKFAGDVPTALGMFLNYARSLSPDCVPDYTDWQRRLKQCTWDGGPMKPWNSQRAIGGTN